MDEWVKIARTIVGYCVLFAQVVKIGLCDSEVLCVECTNSKEI